MKIGLVKNQHKNAVSELGYAFAILGALVMILLSLANFLGFSITLPFHAPIAAMFGSALIGLILGVVAFIGSKHVLESIWAVALLVIGYVGGGLGGMMALFGGVLGILSRFL